MLTTDIRNLIVHNWCCQKSVLPVLTITTCQLTHHRNETESFQVTLDVWAPKLCTADVVDVLASFTTPASVNVATRRWHPLTTSAELQAEASTRTQVQGGPAFPPVELNHASFKQHNKG
ncbi:uncharacterized protein [Dermacentor albipictus]|uniref:uncharacterized protein n=1 Tax=Dermacentor albipictus TaxID=60249 RepID=UPI0038FBF142